MNFTTPSELDSLVSALTSQHPSILNEMGDSINSEYLDTVAFNSKFQETKGLSFFHLNINSLSKHFDDLTVLLESLSMNFSVIGISETRLNSLSLHSNNFDIAGYFHLPTTTESTAGGTSLFISKSLSFTSRSDLSSYLYCSKFLESTFVELSFNNQPNIVVGCIYKHPKFSIPEFNNLISTVLETVDKEGKKLVFLGDFNINLLDFDSNHDVSSFLDTLTSHLILPSISIPTRITNTSKTVIDNILVSLFPHKIRCGNLTVSISDHLPQFLILDSLSVPNINSGNEKFYQDWKNFNRENFILDFFSVDWTKELELHKRDPNFSFSAFYSLLTSLIDRNVPIRKMTKKQIKTSLKPWITKGIKTSIYQRNKFYNLYLRSNRDEDKTFYHDNFKFYRNRIVNLIRNSKINYYNYYFLSNLNNSKNIWKGIKELINNKKSSHPKVSLNINETLESNPEILANHFNKFFTSIADEIRAKIPTSNIHFNSFLKNRQPNSFFFSATSQNEIYKIIISLNKSKASGPFSIPSVILNTIPLEIAKLLSLIFNLSFETGQFISALKTSKVIPIYKKDSPLEVGNYRPISLLSNVDKIFEKIVHSRLTNFLNRYNIIINNQFGFRKKHSTNDALITITEQIRKALDHGHFSCGTFIDLKKAFDTVDHQILLSKLEHYGVRGVSKQWFASYLSDRKQFVSIDNINSLSDLIAHGVPQGSVLGPLLFLIFINDLPSAISHSAVFLFADDTGLLYSDSNLQVIENKVNSDLSLLSSWLKSNMIALNTTKTEVVLFRDPRKPLDHSIQLVLDGYNLSFSSYVNYLGLRLDEHLSFKAHIDFLSTKLSKSNGIIAKLRHFLPLNLLKSVYYSLFQSHLSYGLQIFGSNLSPNSRLYSLQKVALRLMTFSNPRSHSKPLFLALDIPDIKQLLFLSNVLLISKSLSGLSPISIINTLDLNYPSHSYSTRCSIAKLLSRPKVRTRQYGLNSIRYQSILNWNCLQTRYPQHNLDTASIAKIKTLSKAYMRLKQ